MRASTIALALSLVSSASLARAETISIGPSDDFTKIEAAKAGDEVVIAPGTYKFRVHLTAKGTAAQPIVIRGRDPAEPPVWDLEGTLVEDAPGSYRGGDRGRGCWQLDGAEHVRISSIVFQGCRTSGGNSAGIRYLGGTKAIVVRDALFRRNDNGLTGGTDESEMLVEHSEFDHNGKTTSVGNPTHNIYVYGGTFALRYSYVHDPTEGQNFHIRARSSSIDYNWFARAFRYEGDLMSDDSEPEGPWTQEMLFRGNVVVQSEQASNKSQVIAVSNDNGLEQLTLKLRVIANTFVIASPQSSIVHLDDEGPGTKTAEFSNNVVSAGRAFTIDGRHTASGTNNWFPEGANVEHLDATVFGAGSPFQSAAARDFRPAAGTSAVGAASTTVADLPDREYFQNETVTKRYRVRASAKDIGAFESTTTGDGIGAFDAAPAGGPGAAPGSASPATASSGDDGCGCRSSRGRLLCPASVGIALALFAALRRRRS